MLSKATITKLAQIAKVKEEDLLAAIAAEAETDVEVPEIVTYTEDEIKTLKSNSYKEGKTAGVEMNVDEQKKKYGLEFTGKTLEGLLDNFRKHVINEANINPDTRVKELESKVTALQTTVQDYETKMAEKEAEVTTTKINGELYKHIPEFGDNAPALGKDEVIQLMRANGYEPKLENGNTVFYKNGEQLRDKVANPLTAKDVVSQFLQEKKLVTQQQTPSGRGAGSAPPSGKPMTLKELKSDFEKQGKSILGEEFQKAVSQALSDNPEFSMEA